MSVEAATQSIISAETPGVGPEDTALYALRGGKIVYIIPSCVDGRYRGWIRRDIDELEERFFDEEEVHAIASGPGVRRVRVIDTPGWITAFIDRLDSDTSPQNNPAQSTV